MPPKYNINIINPRKKALMLRCVLSQVLELINANPGGMWCIDLMKLYRKRFKCELNYSQFGLMSITMLVHKLGDLVVATWSDEVGDCFLQPAGAPPVPPPVPASRPPRVIPPPDPEDALPGIDYDADVFPLDCMQLTDSIPTLSLQHVRPGAMLEVIVGEVYSPSHFWIIRLGENFNIAMEDLMDNMATYYNGEEGRSRYLARGAMRVGHYCSALYERDWHRAVIVQIVDSDTIKVRHVDYGTVDTVNVDKLRPLRREWAWLPAQATRARLAGVRPCAGGTRWPFATATHFVSLVTNLRVVANVVAVNEKDVMETLLIDTSTADDRCLSAELIRTGHADPRYNCTLWSAEPYLYPSFEALESGATPNLGEINTYLRDGITPDYVDAYRQHVLAPALHDVSRDSPTNNDLSRDSPINNDLPRDSSTCNDAPELTGDTSTSETKPRPPSSPPPGPSTRDSRVSVAPCVRSQVYNKLSTHQQLSVNIPPDDNHRAPQADGPPGLCSPVPGQPGRSPTDVAALSLAKCETYQMLVQINPEAAYWFKEGAQHGTAPSAPCCPVSRESGTRRTQVAESGATFKYVRAPRRRRARRH